MIRPSMRRAIWGTALVAVLSCTDVGLINQGADGPSSPDRAEFTGTVCVPLAAGESFPVKVLYAVEGGAGVDPQLKSAIGDGLTQLASQFPSPAVTFSLVAYHSIARGLQGSFVPAADLASPISQYSSYQEAGPISVRSALQLAGSLVAGDMQTGCKGLVARARYIVVLVMNAKDNACANPNFNPGINAQCNAFLPDEGRCSTCELTRLTEEIKNLAIKHRAGEVVVQPVYVRMTSDPVARFQAAEIARAGGSDLIETDPSNLVNTLQSRISYASLQQSLTLKRLIAFNRNSIARDGQLLLDSDGDAVPDDDETARGTDPAKADTDSDGLMDGVEVKMGMNPLVFDMVNGCNASLDTDTDRLNDCEERVLGTDPCISDSDGDGVPELVELHVGTNPLLPEDLNDNDRDGTSNVQEIVQHTDPNSADIEFQADRSYGYAIKEVDPTPDGRQCYSLRVYNVGLVTPLELPNPPFSNIKRGINNVYIYFQVGRQNDPRGTGIGSLYVAPVQFIAPNRRNPAGVISFTNEEFVLGS